MKQFIPELDEKEISLIREVFDSGILTNYKMVESFEQLVADYIGVNNTVAVSSGTSGLHLALLAFGIKEGDEVIIPALAFPSIINTLYSVGAKPVLVDVNLNSLNLEIRAVEAVITSKTKAIIPLDIFGMPVDISKLRQIAEKHGLKIIEDATYAFGSKIYSTPVGALADAAIFSFNERRVITTAEGGMVVTSDDEIARKIRLLRNHAMERSQKYSKDEAARFVDIGYNYRMSEVHAAIGLAQMNKLESILQKRRDIGKEYTKIIEEIPNVTPAREPLNIEQNYANYVIKLDVHLDALMIKDHLEERDIMTSIGTYCLSNIDIYNIEGCYPVANYVHNYGVSLPINSKMTKKDVLFVCEMLANAIQIYGKL